MELQDLVIRNVNSWSILYPGRNQCRDQCAYRAYDQSCPECQPQHTDEQQGDPVTKRVGDGSSGNSESEDTQHHRNCCEDDGYCCRWRDSGVLEYPEHLDGGHCRPSQVRETCDCGQPEHRPGS